MPTTFPSNLKELVCRGWSEKAKERPPIQEFKSALNAMLPGGETESFNSQTLPETNKQAERELTTVNASTLSQISAKTNPELFWHISQDSIPVPKEIPELNKMYLNASEEKVEKEMENTTAGKTSDH